LGYPVQLSRARARGNENYGIKCEIEIAFFITFAREADRCSFRARDPHRNFIHMDSSLSPHGCYIILRCRD